MEDGTTVNISFESNAFVFGWNHYGQLGLGNALDYVFSMDKKTCPSPFPVDAMKEHEVYFAAAGAFHSAIVNDKGHLMTFGRNDLGQLGHGDTVNAQVPRLVRLLRQKTVSFVCCGSLHTLALTNLGEVFAWGSDEYGQLGFGTETTGGVLYPRKVRLGDGDERSHVSLRVAAGAFHSMAINENGYLYIWGRGDQHQLGLGRRGNMNAPMLVTGLTDVCIVEASAGIEHSAAVSDSGTVYTWGRGAYGQLGHGTLGRRITPTAIVHFAKAGKKIASVACGGMHTLILAAQGDVFSCGLNDFGQLGHGIHNEMSATESLCDPTPKQVRRLLVDEKGGSSGRGEIVKVSAGLSHSAALSKDGQVFTWGAGSSGRLGMGDTSDRALPSTLPALDGREINDISCGYYHTIAVSAVSLDPKFAEPVQLDEKKGRKANEQVSDDDEVYDDDESD